MLLLKICIYCVARKELLSLAEKLLQVICKTALSLRYKVESYGLWVDHAKVSSETALSKFGLQLWCFLLQ